MNLVLNFWGELVVHKKLDDKLYKKKVKKINLNETIKKKVKNYHKTSSKMCNMNIYKSNSWCGDSLKNKVDGVI